MLEKNTPCYCLLNSHCRFCSFVCSPSCCWEQVLETLLCSALATTILVCFPVLVLVEFWFSIFYVLFSTLCVCLSTVEIAASFLWQTPAFLCVTNIFLFVLAHTFGRNSENYAMQNSPPLQFRAFLRCEIQLLKDTQDLQGGWLPVEEHAGKTLFLQPAHGQMGMTAGIAGCWFCTSWDHCPALNLGPSALH